VKLGRQDRLATVARASWGGAGTALILIGCLDAAVGQAQETAPSPPAPAKSSIAAADAAEAVKEAQDEILVTGHRQYGAVATDIAPEVSLNSTAIKALGAADLNEVFRDIAPEIGEGAGKSAAQGSAPIVLVNGQRIAGFSSIKDFPPEAVRRIEIFPKNVALQYGYGLDQRVVNVVLRSNYKALTLLGRYTVAPDNWRGIYRAKVDLIRIGDNSHSNLALDYSHEDAIYADSTLVGPVTPPDGTTVPRHTLAAQHDHLTTSVSTTHKIGEVTAELTGRLDLDTLQSRPGLSNEDGDLLAAEGLPDLVTGPLRRTDRTIDAQTNLTLNGKLDGWRWSFIGNLDDTTRITRTDDAVGAGRIAAVELPSPGLVGYRCHSGDAACVSTNTRQATGDLYLNGGLFSLPAGNVTAAIRTGFAFSGIRSISSFDLQSIERDRSQGSAQANLDFPITSRGSILGKLSVGLNGEARQLSDFGTLTTFGSTLSWSPVKPVSILASFSRTEQAPSLLQLGQATLETPDLREYDFVTGTTTIGRRIEGGNDDLDHETSRIGNVRLQVNPLRAADLALSAEYTIERTRNPIMNVTAATAATMAAFPDRFTRANGYLTSIDVSPVNLVRRDRQQIRWGLNYSTAFGGAWPGKNGAPLDPSKPPSRDQFQIALYDTWRFQDDVVLRNGLPGLNLLGNDIISDGGGTPTHQVELQTTVSVQAWSANISAVWQNSTSAKAGLLSQDRLTFQQGITVNLKLQINLADQHWLVSRIPWLRGSLNLSADNLLGAHTSVHDANGIVPAAYASSYLNPTGRTFRITLRKHFR
jgi:iron complex outermembrane receptor protein